MTVSKYILNDAGEPEPCPNLMAWGKWMEADERRFLKQTTLADGTYISTVFLGLDHGFGAGTPVLWESMIFPEQGEWHELYQDRYTSKAAALAGHEALCAKYRTPAQESEPTENQDD